MRVDVLGPWEGNKRKKIEDKKGGYGCLSRAWFFH